MRDPWVATVRHRMSWWRRIRDLFQVSHESKIRNLAGKHLVISQPENSNISDTLKPLIASPVFLGLMAVAVDLNDEVVVGQVEVDDAVVGLIESVLETIGRSERSEEISGRNKRPSLVRDDCK